MLRIPAAPSQIPSSGIWTAVASLRYRIEMVKKLHLNRAERHAGRSDSGLRYIPTGINLHPRKAYIIPFPHSRIKREAALFAATHLPTHQNFPVRQPQPESEKSLYPLCGGCRAGKFGEGQGGLEGREIPSERGLPAPPRSFLTPTKNPHPRDKMPLRGVD